MDKKNILTLKDLEAIYNQDWRTEQQRKINQQKELDKGKKLTTLVTEKDLVFNGNIRFTLKDDYVDWTGDQKRKPCSVITEDTVYFNNFSVGDLIEIDLEKLNGDKITTYMPLKEEDQDVVKLIKKAQKAKMPKGLNEVQRLRWQLDEKTLEIEELKRELQKERENKKEIVKELERLQKKEGEFMEKSANLTAFLSIIQEQMENTSL